MVNYIKELQKTERLTKYISLLEYPRPIRVAYIVSSEELQNNHSVLQAIFQDAYARWGGNSTLIVPVSNSDFLDPIFEKWLKNYDPDIIYSYCDLTEDFSTKISSMCSPWIFLEHSFAKDTTSWTACSPKWRDDPQLNPVNSLSMLNKSIADLNLRAPTLISKRQPDIKEKFISTNFGIQYDTPIVRNYYYPTDDRLHHTLVFQESIDSHGGYREQFSPTESLAEVLDCVTEKEGITSAYLAGGGFNGIGDEYGLPDWRGVFHLYIGHTVQDKINFWNSNLLSGISVKNTFQRSLIVEEQQLDDEAFLISLCKFLNKNRVYGSRGYATLHVRSVSVNKGDLELIISRINAKLSSQPGILVMLPPNYDQNAIPSDNSYFHLERLKQHHRKMTDRKYREDYQAEAPEHFRYNVPNDTKWNTGTWAIELDVELHESFSNILNVTDYWKLPKSDSLPYLFSENFLARNSTAGQLVIATPVSHYGTEPIKPVYDIYLPEPQDVFHYLSTKNHNYYYQNDYRQIAEHSSFQRLEVSDKSKYFKGLISIFGNLHELCRFITSPIWWEVILTYIENKEVFTLGNIQEIAGKNHATSMPEEFRKSLKWRIQESLIYLIKKNVISPIKQEKQLKEKTTLFERVKHYISRFVTKNQTTLQEPSNNQNMVAMKCVECLNKVEMESYQLAKPCSICNNTVLNDAISKERYLKFNPYIAHAIKSNYFLVPIWALYKIFDVIGMKRSFCFLIEYNIYTNIDDDQQEECRNMDVLAIADGKFYAIEAKRYLTQLLDHKDEVTKFLELMQKLKPDVAVIAAEQFCGDSTIERDFKQERKALAMSLQAQLPELKVEIWVMDTEDKSERYYGSFFHYQ